MSFDSYFFRLPLAKAQWQTLVHQAAVRLQGGPLQGGMNLQRLVDMGSASATGANIDHSTRESAKDVVSAQLVSGEHTVSELQKLQRAEAANLGVNVANTAILAIGLYALYSKLGEATGHLEQLERLTLENRILAERQTETSKAILKALHESRRVEASQLIEQGERNVEAGLIDEAVDRFKKALEFDNTDPVAWMNLAVLYARSAEMDSADEAFRKGLTFSSGVSVELNASIKRSYARFLGAAGRLEEGIGILDDLGESALEDDICERATYLLLVGRKDEARKLLSALLKKEHSYILRLAVDPRIRGSLRTLLDKWLAQAHSHFLKWLAQFLQAMRELEKGLRKHDAPGNLISQVQALRKRLQELLAAKEIASSAELCAEVDRLQGAFSRYVREARETLERRRQAISEIQALWEKYEHPTSASVTQIMAEREEDKNRIQELVREHGLPLPSLDSYNKDAERVTVIVGCLSFLVALVLSIVIGNSEESVFTGLVAFFVIFLVPLSIQIRRAKGLGVAKKQLAISFLEQGLSVPAWTTMPFPTPEPYSVTLR